MYTFFTILAYASLACMLIALWKPRVFPLKNPTKFKAVAFYLVAFIFFFLLSEAAVPDKETRVTKQPPTQDRLASSSGKVAWQKVSQETVSMAENGRDRIIITIVPAEGQEKAKQEDLLLTATGLASSLQKETDVPVVVVRFISQETGNALSEPLLANVVYIPDGKGFDGASSEASEWETLQAAKRGFTKQELEYLKLWGEMFLAYQSSTGTRAADLDKMISKELGVKAGTLNPFANRLEEIPGK